MQNDKSERYIELSGLYLRPSTIARIAALMAIVPILIGAIAAIESLFDSKDTFTTIAIIVFPLAWMLCAVVMMNRDHREHVKTRMREKYGKRYENDL